MNRIACSACGHDNFEGDDVCEECGADLTRAVPAAGRSDLEARLLEDTIDEIELPPAFSVPPSAPVSQAVDLMNQRRVGCVLVVEQGELAGIFTERDLLRRVIPAGPDAAGRPIRDFMTPRPQTLGRGEPIATALKQFMLGDYRHMPVTDGSRVAGLLSVRNLLAYLYDVTIKAPRSSM